LSLLHERGAAVRLKSPIPYAWLFPRGWTDAAVALALGYALFRLADSVAYLIVDVLGQSIGPDVRFDSGSVDELLDAFTVPGPHRLAFTIAGTTFIYGLVLVETVALLLVGLASYGLWRVRNRRLQQCPHCLSRIPRAASVCRECSLEVAS
jgi:hypothetical protein